MSTITERERDLYTDVWQTVEQYGAMSPGEQYVPLFMDMAGIGESRRVTVLDAGAGSGKGALALHREGFRVRMVDVTDAGLVDEAKALPFAQACLWDDLAPVIGYAFGGRLDHVYCCDVLEHIPTPFTMLVVRRLLDVARRGVFLSICLQPDVNGYWVGKPLHQTVQSFTEWRDQLATIGRLQECRDLLHTGLYYVVPRD